MFRSSSSGQHRRAMHHDIPEKANRILHLLLIAMALMMIRVWHLTVIQYDKRLEESRKPQRKTVIEPAIRATIRDRFNLPLAINKMSYQAAILYTPIQQIKSVEYVTDKNGSRIKLFKRKAYIHQLAQLLAQELALEADRLEDLIHSKASYYAQVPFVIKENLSENEYYRLKMLERDWPGIHTRRRPQREYPRGRMAGDIIGYMGAINRAEYDKILNEIKDLEHFLDESNQQPSMELPLGITSLSHARRRLSELEARAYTIHDYVGKTGIEAVFEEQLRGFYGKKTFFSDPKGTCLHELPESRPATSGNRILLTISAELQEYAEQLLIQNEELRVVRLARLNSAKHTILANKQPWIKGGAIVVMDPNTAEILALASYPRFDPNDFIPRGTPSQQKQKKERINRWFENENYIAQIWNQQQPLERERYDAQKKELYEEQRFLTWEEYLNFILPPHSPITSTLRQVANISTAIAIQYNIELLLTFFPNTHLYTIFNYLYKDGTHESYIDNTTDISKTIAMFTPEQTASLYAIKTRLDVHFQQLTKNYDKVLLVDLCRMVVNDELFSSPLLEAMGSESLENHRIHASGLANLQEWLKNMVKNLYSQVYFKKWRQREEKTFLQAKRQEEKAAKSHAKPYLDYLDREELATFQLFWQKSHWELLYAFLCGTAHCNDSDETLNECFRHVINWHHDMSQGVFQKLVWQNQYHHLQTTIQKLTPELALQYLKTLRSYHQLTRSLYGRYRYLRHVKTPLEKHLAAAFYPIYGFGYARSYAYRQSAIQGSLFKLVTAYEALVQHFKKIGQRVVCHNDLNPLIIIDDVYQRGNVRYVGYTVDGTPIPQLYKGGRLPRSLARQHNGRVDLIRALEVSSNPYFAILAGEHLEHPSDLSRAACEFSFGSRTGIDLPYEIAGSVPNDLESNRTGLYAMAIGQHSLVVTPLQTAVMLATIANGGKVFKPKIVKIIVGKQPFDTSETISTAASFRYQKALSMVGIDFPFFSAASPVAHKNALHTINAEVKRELFMPEVIRQILLQGLYAATQHTHHENIAGLKVLYREHPEAIQQFTALKHELLGKTSTSESVEHLDLDLKEGANIYTHVWFGSIAFQEETDKNRTILLCKDKFGKPELIIVVYLHYGGYGKEAAPLAAQILHYWRELKQKHNRSD